MQYIGRSSKLVIEREERVLKVNKMEDPVIREDLGRRTEKGDGWI